MIYIVATTDTKIKNATIAKHAISRNPIFLDGATVSKDTLRDYAKALDLFGASPVVIVDGFIKEGNMPLSATELVVLKDSPTVFIFVEETLKAVDQKKYAPYADITVAIEKKPAQATKINVFAIADAYGRKDKIHTWMLYRDAVDHGLEPEAIAGMLFWKIKTLILQNSKIFDSTILKNHSGELVALYHDAHRGRKDFVIGLEQFILITLS